MSYKEQLKQMCETREDNTVCEPYSPSSKKEAEGLILCKACEKLYESFHVQFIMSTGHVCLNCIHDIVWEVLR